MTKDNLLFIVIGLLAGFMIGFFFANSVNQGALVSTTSSTSSPGTQAPGAQPGGAGALPEGHPAVPGSGGGGAVPEVQAAIDRAKQNPTDFDAQMQAAELYYQINRFEGAIEFLKKASELRPDDYGALVQLGNALLDAGKYDEAEKTYTKALAKKPDDINVRSDFALTYVLSNEPNYDRAIQELKKVLEKDPNHTQALQYMTLAYAKKGDAAAANTTLAKLESVDAQNVAIPRLKEEIQTLGSK